jgi:hypothetical protein
LQAVDAQLGQVESVLKASVEEEQRLQAALDVERR